MRPHQLSPTTPAIRTVVTECPPGRPSMASDGRRPLVTATGAHVAGLVNRGERPACPALWMGPRMERDALLAPHRMSLPDWNGRSRERFLGRENFFCGRMRLAPPGLLSGPKLGPRTF